MKITDNCLLLPLQQPVIARYRRVMLVGFSLPVRPAIKFAFVDTEVLYEIAFGVARFSLPVADIVNYLVTNIRLYPLLV